MNKLVVIPAYQQNVNNIVDFYIKHLDEADIIVFDDYEKVFKFYRFGECESVHSYENERQLKGVFSIVYDRFFVSHIFYDCVIINEHDVKPNESSLYACLDVFEKMAEAPLNEAKLASVSCVYQWNGFHCYPSHTNWWKDKKFIREQLNHVGDVRRIGSQGVPFGFSVWNPEALVFSKMDELPNIWKLDSKAGEFLNQQGYYHLRLLDYKVQHINGGVNSWKKV